MALIRTAWLVCLSGLGAIGAIINTTKPKLYRLTYDDAVDIWPRHWLGEFQHDIAASYGVNPGRVNDVLKERAHYGSKNAAAAKFNAVA